MQYDTNFARFSRSASSVSKNPTSRPATNQNAATAPKVLPPGQWARVVLGFNAPFGHDKMPTIFG